MQSAPEMGALLSFGVGVLNGAGGQAPQGASMLELSALMQSTLDGCKLKRSHVGCGALKGVPRGSLGPSAQRESWRGLEKWIMCCAAAHADSKKVTHSDALALICCCSMLLACLGGPLTLSRGLCLITLRAAAEGSSPAGAVGAGS